LAHSIPIMKRHATGTGIVALSGEKTEAKARSSLPSDIKTGPVKAGWEDMEKVGVGHQDRHPGKGLHRMGLKKERLRSVQDVRIKTKQLTKGRPKTPSKKSSGELHKSSQQGKGENASSRRWKKHVVSCKGKHQVKECAESSDACSGEKPSAGRKTKKKTKIKDPPSIWERAKPEKKVPGQCHLKRGLGQQKGRPHKV